MVGLTQDQITSALRWAMTGLSGMLAGFLISKGLATPGSAAALTTFILGLVPSFGALIWGLWAHSPTSTIASASALPEVQAVVTAPSIAHSAQFMANEKVVTLAESQSRVTEMSPIAVRK